MTEPHKPIALENRECEEDRLFAPSAARNRAAIVSVLQRIMPPSGKILEIASGTGEHAIAITAALPKVRWQPTDPDAKSRRSIDAWRRYHDRKSILPARDIATDRTNWTEQVAEFGPVDGIVCINMIHIAPIKAANGLLQQAHKILRPNGFLFFYGPFKREGIAAPSNMAFDEALKAQDPGWGVRDLDHHLVPIAAKHDLELEQVLLMPANNLSVIFRKG